MLLTMDDYYREEYEEMPHPERIDKVSCITRKPVLGI